MNNAARIFALVSLLAAGAAASAQAQRPYTVNRITVGGEGGWDYLYVEPSGHRLFVSRGTHVQVIDIAQRKLVGDIPNTNGVHGIVIVPEAGRGYTTNGRDSTVTVFDATSLAPLASIQIPSRGPDAILYEPHSNRIFTMNHSGNSVSAIDVKSGRVVGTTPIGGTAEAAVSDEHHVYINLEDKSEIVKVDAGTLEVAARWSLAPCEEPTGLAFDAKSKRLFAGCGNKLMAVVNSESGKVIATLPIGAGVDGVAFDPVTRNAFSSNGEGSITVVHEDTPDKFTVTETIPTQRGARTIALDPRTHALYLSTAQFGETPAATAAQPRPRAPMIAGSFMVLEVRPIQQ